MKRWKKWLSAGLAVCVLTSSLSVGLIASAAQDETAVQKSEAAVQALMDNKTSITTAAPVVPEDTTDPNYEKKKAALEAYNTKLELYAQAVSSYKTLSESEKDTFDVKLALSMLKAFNEREAFLIKTDYDSKLPEGAPAGDKMSAVESRVQAQATMNEKLGRHAAREEGFTLAMALYAPYKDNLTLTAKSDFSDPDVLSALKKVKRAFEDATPLARQYADGVSGMFKSYAANTQGVLFRTLVQILSAYNEFLDPCTLEKPANPSAKPLPKNYAGGATDPAYLADLAAWLPQKEAYQAYSCGVFNHTANMNLKAIDELAALAPELGDTARVMRQLRDAYKAFQEEKTTDAAKEAMQAYDKLDAYSQLLAKTAEKAYSYYWLNDAKNDYSHNNLSFNQLYSKCEETGGMALVQDFVDYIDGIDLAKVTNETVAEAKEQYKLVPTAMRTAIPEDTLLKYEEIISKYIPIGPITPSDEKFEEAIAQWKKTEVSYSAAMSKEKTAALLATLEEQLPVLLEMIPAIKEAGGLEGLLEQGVYTNAALGTVLNLYTAIEQANLVVSAGISLNISEILGSLTNPKELAAYLTEEKFAGAKAKLEASIKDGASSTADYAGITFQNGDWGFEDGDRDGFVNALVACLRPVGNLLTNGFAIVSQILLLPNTTASNGDYVYGAYEYLIPVFEALGMENVLSSEEYSKRYYEAAKVSKGAQLDALFLPIINSALGLMDKFMKAPVDTLLTALPNLAKIINDGALTDSVNGALQSSSLLGGVSIDLSGDAVNTMISGLLNGIKVGDATLNINLSSIDWARLAGAGTAVLRDSASASNSYRVAVDADKADAFQLTFRYLFDNLFTKEENFKGVQALITSLLPDAAGMVNPLLGTIRGLGPDGALNMVYELLGGEAVNPDPADPTPEPQPIEKEEPPKTGDAILSIMGATSLAAAAAYVLTRKRHA